jgi:AcrR family transcriptional regulator
MSPRPRQATDEQILAATFQAVSRVGPLRLTLADVAREAGVSAPALVQRFGSKRDLLLAAVASGAGAGGLMFAGLKSKHRSPYAALVGLADCIANMGATPEAIANTLAFLQLDLTDPDFHRHALMASAETRRGIQGLVRDAVSAGEMVVCNTARLAGAIQATMNGSLLNWAIHRDGDLVRWVRRDLVAVLEGYRAGRR